VKRALLAGALALLVAGGLTTFLLVSGGSNHSYTAPSPSELKQARIQLERRIYALAGQAHLIVPPGLEPPRHDVFYVKRGMTGAEVYFLVGKPDRVGGPYGAGCWFYPASKPGTSIVGMTFCFKSGRVSRVQIGVHA
jgi:hypothetical protein